MANPGNDPKETMSLTYPPTTKGPMSPWCKSSLPWCDRACTLGFSFRFRHKLLRNGHRTVDGCPNCCWNLPIRWPVQYIPWKYHEWGWIPHTSIYTWRYYQPIFHFLQLLKRMNGVKCSDLEASTNEVSNLYFHIWENSSERLIGGILWALWFHTSNTNQQETATD